MSNQPNILNESREAFGARKRAEARRRELRTVLQVAFAAWCRGAVVRVDSFELEFLSRPDETPTLWWYDPERLDGPRRDVLRDPPERFWEQLGVTQLQWRNLCDRLHPDVPWDVAEACHDDTDHDCLTNDRESTATMVAEWDAGRPRGGLHPDALRP